MSEPYNIKSPFPIKISQMRVGDVGYVGGGNWKRVRGAYFTFSGRFLYPEDETHIVMVKKTPDGIFCLPCPWMMNLELEKVSDIPRESDHWIRIVPILQK